MSLVYLDAASKTVTCTVSINGDAPTTPTVTDEGDGRYTATMSGSAGWVSILWKNTTDVKEYRELRYWDGEAFVAPINGQQVRDAMSLAHTNTNPSIDVMLQNVEALSIGV